MALTGPAITQGYRFDFYQKLVVNTTNFNANCDIVIPFSTYTVTFQLEAGGPLSYSFNGNYIAGDMTLTLPSANLVFENRVISKIWWKGNGTVRIEAWSIR